MDNGKQLLIDFLLPYAGHSGVEIIINLLGRYLQEKGIAPRVVQLVYGGEQSIDSAIEFHSIYPNGLAQTTETLCQGYVEFLQKHKTPDAILAVAWPGLCYVAQLAKSRLGLSAPVASYLHASVGINEKEGWGGMDALRYADLHFAISNAIAEEISAGIQEAIIYRICNPLRPEVIFTTPIKRKSFKLVYVGRLVNVKRVEIILSAVALAEAPWVLEIYGEGKEKNSLMELSDKLHIEERVRFLGWQENPWENARDAAFCIIASNYESCCTVALEALANGVPILSTPCDGVKEYICDGVNGFRFDFEDVFGLVRLLDGISCGELNYPDAGACRQSATPFLMESALYDFYIKLYATARGKILSTRYVPGCSLEDVILNQEKGERIIELLE